MAGEQVEEVYAIKVFADEAETRLILRVTMQGDVQIINDLKAPEAMTLITQLAKMVFKLRNDDALRIEEEKLLDQRIGTRSKLKQETMAHRAEIEELKRQLAKATAAR